MKNKLNEELKDIKYLFNYNRGRVISEQELFESDKEEYDDEEYKDRSMYDPYYGDDDEEYDYMVDPNAEETLPSFDSSSSGGKYLGMAKPMGDMDTRTPEERERDRGDIGMELEEEMDLDTFEMGENTKEKERTKVKPGTKPKTPSTPYKPKPGPKPDPKARKRKGDMPTWLTFDELGIDFE
jgi:hypothetical protein